MPEETIPPFELPFSWNNRTIGKVTRTIVEDTCGNVAEAYGETRADCEMTAEFIVRACNHHYEAISMLETLAGHVSHYGSMPHAHSDAYRNEASANALIRKMMKGQP